MIDGWLAFIWTGLDVNLYVRQHQQSHNGDDRQPLTRLQTILQKNFQILDTHLQDRKCMVGNGITLADISLGVTLKNAVGKDMILDDHSNLSQWYQMICDEGILKS